MGSSQLLWCSSRELGFAHSCADFLLREKWAHLLVSVANLPPVVGFICFILIKFMVLITALFSPFLREIDVLRENSLLRFAGLGRLLFICEIVVSGFLARLLSGSVFGGWFLLLCYFQKSGFVSAHKVLTEILCAMDATANVENQQRDAARTGPRPRYNGKSADLNTGIGNMDGKQNANDNDVLNTHIGDYGQRGSDRCKVASGSNKHGLGSSSSTSDASVPATKPVYNQVYAHPPRSKKSFSSLFSDNRVPSDASRLTYIEPPVGNSVLGLEEIDSVEKAFGHCLVGYVMGPRPSPYSMINYVKRWDNDIKFTFKENGWIRFQFPSELVRDRVLNGGPYLIFGKQLFLKKFPSCFMFSKEDMIYFPSWVQIFGLPEDCWTEQALSKIASVVGKPLHTDMLTISKKGATFARVLL